MLLAFNNFYVASFRGFLCVPIFKTLLNVPFCYATCFSYHIPYIRMPCIYRASDSPAGFAFNL